MRGLWALFAGAVAAQTGAGGAPAVLPPGVGAAVLLLGARYGVEAACHLPAHDDLNFVMDRLRALGDKATRDLLADGFGAGAAGVIGEVGRMTIAERSAFCDDESKTIDDHAEKARLLLDRYLATTPYE